MGGWRKLTIGVDGVDGAGKSSIASFLAWQIGMPAIDLDMLLDQTNKGFSHRIEDLRRLIEVRHSRNRPLIVEGVFLLKVLEPLKIQPEILVYVEKAGHEGSITWQQDFEMYAKKYASKSKAHFVFTWREAGSDNH